MTGIPTQGIKMKLPPNDRYFPTESPAEDYDKEMAAADVAFDVESFVQLVRGRCQIHWNKTKPHQIQVSEGLYQSMQEVIASNKNVSDQSLCMVDGMVMICGIKIVQKPE